MKLPLLFVLCAFAFAPAHADEAAQCASHDGTWVTGRVTGTPLFIHGHLRDGVELSHTHLTLQSGRDGQTYDVAVDNVFAAGYDRAGEAVPAPLSTVRAGDRVDVCGKMYTDDTGRGIDWVHINCGATPTANQPNGWFELLNKDGTPGPNLESSREYCRLWAPALR